MYSTVSKMQLCVGDAVHMRSPSDEATKPYVAAIIAMYQDVEKGSAKGKAKITDKMIIIEWFFRLVL